MFDDDLDFIALQNLDNSTNKEAGKMMDKSSYPLDINKVQIYAL